MYRRQLLRAAALGATAAALPAASVRADGQAGTDTPANGTETGTPTPTPTEPVATPTSAWEPRGRVAVPGVAETVPTPDGETAFAATGDGFAVLDLSDPAEPTVLTREAPVTPTGSDVPMADVFDVAYDDGRLLVAGPANYAEDAFYGAALFDVTDPAAPEIVGAHETTYPVHNCYLDGDHAYLTGNDDDRNPLVVVEMGAEPAEVARWSLPGHDEAWSDVDASLRVLHDVFVTDGYAYLAHWDAGTWILDVSDPTDPTYAGDVGEQSVDDLRDADGLDAFRLASEPPGNDHYAATDPAGDLLAVGKESWNSNVDQEGTTPGPDDPGGPSGIDLYDVTEPSDPEHLATVDPPPTADPNFNGVRTTAHNFELTGEYLYSSWYRGGVKIHDVSDPADPEEVRHFRRSADTSFWTARLAVPGETAVATSYRNPADLANSGVVYTFPDVPRETPTATADPTDTPTDDGSVDLLTDAPTATDDPRTAAAEGPGFGPFAALVGVGLGAWRLLGGSRGDTDTAAED